MLSVLGMDSVGRSRDPWTRNVSADHGKTWNGRRFGPPPRNPGHAATWAGRPAEVEMYALLKQINLVQKSLGGLELTWCGFKSDIRRKRSNRGHTLSLLAFAGSLVSFCCN